MSFREPRPLQLAALMALTATYLCFELAFNARLLDVVGTAAGPKDIHNIEVSGRLLSGAAVALVVLQILLAIRNSSGEFPGWRGILLSCAATVVVVFFSIRALVDHVVESQSAEFRRTAVNIVLVQRALVTGEARLAALVADETTFASPEGKSFLALFPVLAMSVSRLEEKIRDSKLAVLRALIERETGGAGKLYDQYRVLGACESARGRECAVRGGSWAGLWAHQRVDSGWSVERDYVWICAGGAVSA